MARKCSKMHEVNDYHPCNTPRGSQFYILDDITEEMQEELNIHKMKIIRENHTYLKKHPEIRAIIALILREILKKRPRKNVHKMISNYFQQSIFDIQNAVYNYLSEKGYISTINTDTYKGIDLAKDTLVDIITRATDTNENDAVVEEVEDVPGSLDKDKSSDESIETLQPLDLNYVESQQLTFVEWESKDPTTETSEAKSGIKLRDRKAIRINSAIVDQLNG